eukprot:scaffold1928_cov63-Phaeocystis_antarctica.AAC.4
MEKAQIAAAKARHLLHAICYLLPATCYLLPATCCLLPATCCLLPATCYLALTTNLLPPRRVPPPTPRASSSPRCRTRCARPSTACWACCSSQWSSRCCRARSSSAR